MILTKLIVLNIGDSVDMDEGIFVVVTLRVGFVVVDGDCEEGRFVEGTLFTGFKVEVVAGRLATTGLGRVVVLRTGFRVVVTYGGRVVTSDSDVAGR